MFVPVSNQELQRHLSWKCCGQWFEARCGQFSTFCWYWRNCLSSLFKIRDKRSLLVNLITTDGHLHLIDERKQINHINHYRPLLSPPYQSERYWYHLRYQSTFLYLAGVVVDTGIYRHISTCVYFIETNIYRDWLVFDKWYLVNDRQNIDTNTQIVCWNCISCLCIFSATVDYCTFVLGIMLETEPFCMYMDQLSKMTTVVKETKKCQYWWKQIHLNWMWNVYETVIIRDGIVVILSLKIS